MNDLISRQAALDILYDFAGEIVDTPGGHYNKAYKEYRKRMESLPSAEPVHGGWVLSDGYRCSVCCHKLQTTGLPIYCPSCGAKMTRSEK